MSAVKCESKCYAVTMPWSRMTLSNRYEYGQRVVARSHLEGAALAILYARANRGKWKGLPPRFAVTSTNDEELTTWMFTKRDPSDKRDVMGESGKLIPRDRRPDCNCDKLLDNLARFLTPSIACSQ